MALTRTGPLSSGGRRDSENPELSRVTSASILFLRHLLGGKRAENLIHRLGFSDLRSFYYLALARLHTSYHGPKRIARQSTSYYEFGVGWGYTLSRYLEALTAFCYDEHLNPYHHNIFLFDSFAGLPEKKGIEDDHSEWSEGMFAHTIDEIRQVIKNRKMDPDSGNFRFIKGFYEQVLTPELREHLARTPPDIVTVDVDYYSSTKIVLEWLRPILPSGSLFYFDDVWSFNGSPNRGELRAINEFNNSGQGFFVPFGIVPTLPNHCYIYARE